jgi:hypothetical protein
MRACTPRACRGAAPPEKGVAGSAWVLSVSAGLPWLQVLLRSASWVSGRKPARC